MRRYPTCAGACSGCRPARAMASRQRFEARLALFLNRVGPKIACGKHGGGLGVAHALIGCHQRRHPSKRTDVPAISCVYLLAARLGWADNGVVFNAQGKLGAFWTFTCRI